MIARVCKQGPAFLLSSLWYARCLQGGTLQLQSTQMAVAQHTPAGSLCEECLLGGCAEHADKGKVAAKVGQAPELYIKE